MDPSIFEPIDPLVPMDIRVFMVMVGFLFCAIGLFWVNGYPRHKSQYGLQFRIAMDSAEIWRTLHRRVGRLLIGVGLWWFVPFESLKNSLFIQIPIGGAGTIFGVLLIKYLLEKNGEQRDELSS